MGTSFSEGEVPYSPGDARWYSLYAATMNKAGLTGWKPKPKRKLDPTMETFLDLKNSPDPSTSESSQLLEDPDKVNTILGVSWSAMGTVLHNICGNELMIFPHIMFLLWQ